jgi:hypothetical protein
MPIIEPSVEKYFKLIAVYKPNFMTRVAAGNKESQVTGQNETCALLGLVKMCENLEVADYYSLPKCLLWLVFRRFPL